MLVYDIFLQVSELLQNFINNNRLDLDADTNPSKNPSKNHSQEAKNNNNLENFNINYINIKKSFALIKTQIEHNFSSNIANFLFYIFCCYGDDIIIQQVKKNYPDNIINSSQNHLNNKLASQTDLLEIYFFNTQIGGEKFFNIIDQIKEDRGFFLFDQIMLAYLVLTCGFKGKFLQIDNIYTTQDTDYLNNSKNLLYEKLQNSQFIQDNKCFLNPLLLDPNLKQVLPKKMQWLQFFILFLVVYFILSSLVWYIYVNYLYAPVGQIASQIFDI